MRLVKIKDFVLNMDNIVMIKGRSEGYEGGVGVYAVTTHEEICLGVCDNRESYQRFIDAVYKELSINFKGETVYTEEDEEKEEELWK